jgi:hypothetical protein
MFENANSTNTSVKEGLSNFRKYLKETGMCEDSYIKKLDKIIECSPELLALKRKVSSIDVTTLIPDGNSKQRNPEKKLGTKKTTRITSPSCSPSTPSYSSTCGSSSSYSSSCGPSGYSNRC